MEISQRLIEVDVTAMTIPESVREAEQIRYELSLESEAEEFVRRSMRQIKSLEEFNDAVNIKKSELLSACPLPSISDAETFGGMSVFHIGTWDARMHTKMFRRIKTQVGPRRCMTVYLNIMKRLIECTTIFVGHTLYHVKINHALQFIVTLPATAETTCESTAVSVPMCTVCLDHHVQVAYNKCGHVCACYACARKMAKKSNACPLCRESSNGFGVIWGENADAPCCVMCKHARPDFMDGHCATCAPHSGAQRLFWD
jgi:hypothetical protein